MFINRFNCKLKWQRLVVTIAIVLWIISALRIVNESISNKDDKGMIATFSENVSSTNSVDIQVFGQINSLSRVDSGNVSILESAKRAILIDAAKRLAINRYEIKTDESGKMALSQDSANGKVRISLFEKEESFYLSLIVSLEKGFECVDSYRSIVSEIAKDNGIDSMVSVNVSGMAKGNISTSEKNAMTRNILSGLKAKEISANKNTDVYTVYAYSKSMDDYIQVGKNKINVNITMNYDEKNDITHINMSTPIYNGDY